MRFWFVLILSFSISSIGAQTCISYPDNSADTSMFRMMKLPSLDSEWSIKNFDRALKLFVLIKQKDKFSLPRKGSNYSGMVFTKVEDFPSGKIIKEYDDIQATFQAADSLNNILNTFLNLYFEPGRDCQRFGSELLVAFNKYLEFIFSLTEKVDYYSSTLQTAELKSLQKDLRSSLVQMIEEVIKLKMPVNHLPAKDDNTYKEVIQTIKSKYLDEIDESKRTEISNKLNKLLN